MSENSPNVVWQDPDFINPLGVCRDDFSALKAATESLDDSFAAFMHSFKNGIINREVLYYYNLLMNDLDADSLKQVLETVASAKISNANSGKLAKAALSKINYGYAVLKGKAKTYYITKLSTVIGRRNHLSDSNVTWQVDINFKKNPEVSTQHAVVLYNFDIEKFEIKCLSEKYPIKVNNIRYDIKDEPISLDNNALIMIGDENLYFLLPKKG